MYRTNRGKTAVRAWGRYLPLALGIILCFAAVGMAAPKPVIVTGELITIQLDEDVCEGQPSFCVDTGSFGGASSTNGNAILMVVQVIGPNSVPVTGLTSSDFTLRGAFLAVDVVFANCASCFDEIGDGLYLMVLEPFNNFDWVEGTYHYQLQVSVGAGIIYSLFSFEIPL